MRILKTKVRSVLLPGFVLLATVSWLTPVHAWGPKGHAIVGGIADLRLQSAHARQQVALILGGEKLSDVASWPDYVRHLQPGFAAPPDHPELATDPDSIGFVNEFYEVKPTPPGHVVGGSAPWHIVHLPLDAAGYDAPGVAEHFGGKPLHEDIVMRIQSCIAILQSDAPIHGAWGKHNALRTLVHLVGDLHMPLHVGTGYVDPDQTDLGHFIVTDSARIEASHLNDDSQGNGLIIPDGKQCESLHAFWDENMVDKAESDAVAGKRVAGGETPQLTTARYTALLASLAVGQGWTSAGALSTWPAQWTRDSLRGARTAYAGIQVLDNKKAAMLNNYGKTSEGYPIKLSEGYADRMAPLAEDQLARAGFRLADLLDQIWP